MQMVKSMMSITILITTLFFVAGCSTKLTPTEQHNEQDRLRKMCNIHYAHIEGLNDGRYARSTPKDYTGATGCKTNRAGLNKEYLEGFNYGKANK